LRHGECETSWLRRGRCGVEFAARVIRLKGVCSARVSTAIPTRAVRQPDVLATLHVGHALGQSHARTVSRGHCHCEPLLLLPVMKPCPSSPGTLSGHARKEAGPRKTLGNSRGRPSSMLQPEAYWPSWCAYCDNKHQDSKCHRDTDNVPRAVNLRQMRRK
jgi:hypothetical protein